MKILGSLQILQAQEGLKSYKEYRDIKTSLFYDCWVHIYLNVLQMFLKSKS